MVLTVQAGHGIVLYRSVPMKRFVIGFLIGVGLMYYYLHHADDVKTLSAKWFTGNAAKYRGDRHHDAAREALGGNEQRP